MNYSDLLPLFAEVAIAITGFSGIVSIFGRDKNSWSAADITRLISLLTASLSAFIFSLIALALISSGISEHLTWRIASGLIAIERIVWIFRITKTQRVFAISKQVVVFFYIFTGGNIAMMLLSAANAIFLQIMWPFAAAIVWYLIESSWVFVRLVLFPLRGATDDGSRDAR